ncbi:MAG: tetratricopeptide repeat protein [Acidobacteria bacterium]|nr:tetratricopeptide repeat protein [Acidobacteriota bacterium]
MAIPSDPDPSHPSGFRESLYRLTHGRQALLWLALGLAPAFSVTAIVSEAHRAEYRTLAYEWRIEGENALRAGRSDDAIEAFRSALRFAREDRTLRLRLAEALAAADRGVEARAYLQGLWQEQPGNGRVNLELARVAAAEGNAAAASRYYQNAIQGAWDDDAEQRRRETRLEHATFLVEQNLHARAEAELIALAADLPPDAEMRPRTGRLLAAAGSHRRALDVFDTALKMDPQDLEALRGAGAAALALGDHAAVVRYLQRVPAGDAGPELAFTLDVSRQVLGLDPYRRGLSSRERAARARRALERAGARLRGCEDPAAELVDLRERAAAVLRTETIAVLARDPERLDDGFAQAVAAIRASEPACGPLTPADRALLLLGAVAPETGQ